MEAKYYTPKAEEFHLGFEFECHIDNGLISKSHYKEGQEWKRTEWGIFDYIKTKELSLVRVKHLDQEDIEELGFSKRSKGTWAGFIDYEYNTLIDGEVDYFLRASIHIPVMGDRWRILLHRNLSDDTNIDNKIKEAESSIVFDGKIKNKSELKRLMVQLGITKE